MAEIYVVPEILRESAVRINNIHSEMEDMLHTVQMIVNEMLAGWEGKAKEAFITAFDEKKLTYQEFGIDMSSFSVFLQRHADEIEDLDLTGVEIFSGI